MSGHCFHMAVFCWGNAANGELGLGGIEVENVPAPQPLHTFSNVHHVRDGSCGHHHNVLLLDTGHVYTCGSNDLGQLGHFEARKKFELVAGLRPHIIQQVSTRGDHTLALSEAGQVFSWGANQYGQLGYPTDGPSSQPRMVKKLALYHTVQIAAGSGHSLALSQDGHLFTWGQNNYGQLGVGHSGEHTNVPSLVTALHGVPLRLVTAGSNHSFVLSHSGALFGWGHNVFGQLGINCESNSPLPKAVFSLRSHFIKYVCCGDDHTAALTKDGGVFTFGAGMYGQLGHGSRNNEILPRKVIELMGSIVTQIACGRCHTLAFVPHQAKVYSFGLGGNGQLGTGSYTNANTPILVRGPWGRPHASSPLLEEGHSWGRKRSGSESRIHRQNSHYSDGENSDENFHQVPKTGHSYVVYKILAGGDHSFMLATNGSVPPQDFRSPLPAELSILHLDTSLISRATTTEESMEDQDDMTNLEAALCSSACLNNSFLLPHDKHYNCSPSNIGVDFTAAYAAFNLLEDSLSEMVASSLEVQLLPSFAKFHSPNVDIESLRLLVTLPLCSLFHHVEEHMVSLHIPFAKICLGLSSHHSKVYERWLTIIEIQHFRNLVQIYKKCVVYLLSENWKPMDLQRHSHLRTSLDFLAMLNKVNTDNMGIISYEEFYIREISDKVDVAADYSKWVFSQNTTRGSNVFFCDYSFVFDANAKTTILQTDSYLRMRQAVEQAQTQSFAGFFLGAFQPTVPFLVLNVSRDNLVQDTLGQLCSQKTNDFKKPLKVIFHGEEAVDAGGVTKEFFLLLLTEILDPKYGMFIEYKETRCIWFNSQSFEEDNMYYLIGILCGLAIYNFIIINLPFPLVLYKKLLDEQVQLEDLKGLSPRLVQSLQELLHYEEDDFEEVFMLTFEISTEVYGSNVITPLKEGGSNIPVTKENRKEYVDLYVDFILNRSVSSQFTAFNSGFHKVVERKVLKLFHAEELMSLVIGKEEYNWEELEENAEYKEGYHKNHPTIRMFWSVFHSLSHEEKKNFLLFLTGSDRIPLQGMKAVKIVIQPMNVNDSYLPVAHTCFNILDLPPYSNAAIMKDRLCRVIKHTQGFGLA